MQCGSSEESEARRKCQNFKCKVIKMPSKQSAPTPKRTRLSYKDKAAIIEAARKGGGKEAVRDKMMSEYQIGRTAYHSIF